MILMTYYVMKIKRVALSTPCGYTEVFAQSSQIALVTDLVLEGYSFTWARGRGKANRVEERLDRATVTPSWLLMFPEARLRNLVAAVSDHSPIELNTSGRGSCRRRRPFRLKNKWLKEPDLNRMVMEIWEKSQGNPFVYKLTYCSTSLDE